MMRKTPQAWTSHIPPASLDPSLVRVVLTTRVWKERKSSARGPFMVTKALAADVFPVKENWMYYSAISD